MHPQSPALSRMCVKFVVLKRDYIHDTKIARDVSRYAEISQVVLLPAMIDYSLGKSFNASYIEKVVYGVFHESFYLSAYSLFLIVDNGAVFKWKTYITKTKVHRHPANMILVKFKTIHQNSHKTVVPFMHYMCYNYCSKRWSNIREFGLFLQVVNLHKMQLYNANARSIKYKLFPTATVYPRNLLDLCENFIPLRCGGEYESKIMVVLTIKNIHNFTGRIFSFYVPSQRRAYKSNFNPYISSQTHMKIMSNTSISITYQIMYSEDFNSLIYYCRDETLELQEASIGFLHWIVPFTFSLWILCLILIVIPVFVTYYHTKSVSDSVSILIGVVGEVLKQHTNVVDKKLLVFTSFSALIVCSFYESQITSLAMAQIRPPTIQTLQELINKGYKLLKTEGASSDAYRLDFKFRNIENVFNESWFVYKKRYGDYDSAVYRIVNLLARSTKNLSYAGIKDNKLIQYTLLETTELIRQQTGVASYACHSVPDKIGKSQDFWKTSLKNKHWLEVSLSYMNAAGLPQIWDSWANWVDRHMWMMDEWYLREEGNWLGDSLFHKKELGPAFITIQELVGFLLLALCPVIISIVLLALEICKHWVDNKNKNNVVIISPIATREDCGSAIASKHCFGFVRKFVCFLQKFITIPQNCRQFPNGRPK
ncbi:unnamed protein product [Orchesella dallaii]|uniref:Uncharacterized protein n=1 Tax=Orchesella dallaii TaxID=48710 RepID=A0ABP1QCY3_9HEXA